MLLITTFLACSIAGMAVLFTHFNAAADGSDATVEKEPAYTVYLGEGGLNSDYVLYEENFENGWNQVVGLAKSIPATAYIKAVLLRDWLATGSPATSFGVGDNFDSGRIKVPQKTNITIDLNGHSIDRAIVGGATNGQVIIVEGSLTVVDGGEGGKITGGYNTNNRACGGGVYIHGGTLNLRSGAIEGNRILNQDYSYGGGVGIEGGTFNMYGGTVANNTNTNTNSDAQEGYGGGVGIYSSGTFNMYGGVLEGNSALNGGGVGSMSIDTVHTVNIEGGIIRGNTASIGGGGVFARYRGNITVKNAEICNNKSGQFGGGVYVWTNNYLITFKISGANIHHNVVSSLSNAVYGGGVAVRVSSSNNTAIINADIDDSVIANNLAITKCENTTAREAQGGGIFVMGSTVTFNGGEISNNRAGSFKDADGVGNLEDICDGKKTYGGGVYVEKPGNYPCGVFVLNDGTISGNRSGYGGGVYVNGELSLHGGSIKDNNAIYGGGLHLGANAKVLLSGTPVVADNHSVLGAGSTLNNLQISSGDTQKIAFDGALEEGARIGVAVDKELADSGSAVIQNYGKYNTEFASKDGRVPDSELNPTNGVWAYSNPYNYFVSDTAYIADGASSAEQLSSQNLIVLANGDLVLASNAITFTVKYSDNNTKQFTYGTASGDIPAWNYTESAFGDAVRPVSVSANGSEKNIETADAGVYTLKAKVNGEGDAEIAFTVIVKAKTLTLNDVTVTLSNDNFVYDGKAKEPTSCTVNYGSTTFHYGVEYNLGYKNNIEAGLDTAIVVVSFTGNYTGEVLAYFSINSSSEHTTTVTWQIKNGTGGWDTLSDYDTAFTFDGTDQRGKIRALLFYNDGEDHTQTVYAKGVETDGDVRQNAGMWLAFNGGASNEFKNAGAYTIKIEGYSNYVLDVRVSGSIKMNPKSLTIRASDFANYKDVNDTRLWQLQIGSADEGILTNLVDNATYADPDAAPNKFNEKVTTGELKDAYARYRGVELSLVLNPAYLLADGSALQEWLDIATVTYVHEGEKVGVMEKVNYVKTTVTITFGSNYSVDGETYITFFKEWYIVTISNGLRDATTTEEVLSNELQGWTFGAFADELRVYAFRPEHGDTVIYSYYLAGTDTPVEQFAIRYSGTEYNASKQFYEVQTVNGEFVVSNIPINDSNYLYTVNFNLRAGNYRLEVTVPQNEPLEGEHHHWWDGDSTATDNGVRYYKFTFVFTLEIETYALATEEGEANEGISWTFPQNSVEYNGKADNIAEPVIRLNGLMLIRDVDYTLSCDRVDIGLATLTIEGKNSLTGMLLIVDAFQIVQGDNGWEDVPSIISWSYNSFNKELNLITAKSFFGEVQFSISRNREGTDIITDIGSFTVDEKGRVSDEVAKALKALNAGNYYLIGRVEGTDNYRILEPNPIQFAVLSATNSWETTPSVNAWTEGEYSKNGNHVLASPVFGYAHVVIKGDDGKIYYDSDNGIDELANAKAGRYTLTAYVDGAEDYSALDIYTVVFQIFEKPGLPWWAILLIVIASLGVAALVIFILWKRGVFQIVTEKFIVAIRTRASVEATMASVRAAKMMEEGRQSIEDAKRRERIEKMRQKEEAQLDLSPEERAAQLEAKAQADEKKAEKLRVRSEETRAQAAKMRAEEGSSEEAKGTTQKPENPTEK